jgi:uncharacterized protein
VRQPERWTVAFSAPQRFVSAEFWVGNAFVTVRRSDPNVWAFLNNLHEAGGMGAGWILVADGVAGSFILLSLTGVALWTRCTARGCSPPAWAWVHCAWGSGSPARRCERRWRRSLT